MISWNSVKRSFGIVNAVTVLLVLIFLNRPGFLFSGGVMEYTLRTRTRFVLLIVFTLLGGTPTLVHRQILLPSFLDLERKHIDSNVRRVIRALDNEAHHLSLITNDWSIWDDTYEYIENHNSEYALSKLVTESNLRQQHNNVFCNVTILRFVIIYSPRKSNWSAIISILNQVKNQ